MTTKDYFRLFNFLRKPFEKTMQAIGIIICTVYIMGQFGFHGKSSIPCEIYPYLVIGTFLGLVFNAYHLEE